MWAALAGLIAAGVALGVAELLAALIGPNSSPVIAIGDLIIRNSPQFMTKSRFGTSARTTGCS